MSGQVPAAAIRASSLPIFGTIGPRQVELLKHVVAKHIQDPSLAEMIVAPEFGPTSTERGVMTWEHQHIVAALDVLNSYQRDRRAKATLHLFGKRAAIRKSYRQDARTRLVELLKRWLRSQATVTRICEGELKSMSGLCRDVLTHPQLFPPRNGRSFIRTLAEVYDHLQWQLREVLERDKTCAELAQRVLSLSRNLLSDALAYLLLAATDIKQTDVLPSLEVVTLWQSLPIGSNPLPSRADPALQKAMKDGWSTRCGSLVGAVASTTWCVRLFDGAGAKEEATTVGSSWTSPLPKSNTNMLMPAVQSTAIAVAGAGDQTGPEGGTGTEPQKEIDIVPALVAAVRAEFLQDRYKQSGLVGVLRRPELRAARESYLSAVEAAFDLTYLMGEALVQFHRISDGLGDYGMIRVAPWLHPFLEALVDKVQLLKTSLKHLDEVLDKHMFLAKAHGRKVEGPVPSARMNSRAHDAIGRAITNQENHVQSLLQALEDLRARSAPERLPNVMEGLGDACMQLSAVLSSPEFRQRVGDAFPAMPALGVAMHAAELIPSPSSEALALRDDFAVEVVPGAQKDEGEGELDFDADVSFNGVPEPRVADPAAEASNTPTLVPPFLRSLSTPAAERFKAVAVATASATVIATTTASATATATASAVAREAKARSAAVPRPPASVLRSAAWLRKASSSTSSATEIADDTSRADVVSGDRFFPALSNDDDTARTTEEGPVAAMDAASIAPRDAFVPAKDAGVLAAARSASSLNPFEDDCYETNGTTTSDSKVGSGVTDTEPNPFSQDLKITVETVTASQQTAADLRSGRPPLPGNRGDTRQQPFAVTAGFSTGAPSLENSDPPQTSSSGSLTPASTVTIRTEDQASPVKVANTEDIELRSEVFRLTTAFIGHGFRRHDRRSLKLWDGFLHVFSKGSTRLVKAVLHVGRDIQDCSLVTSTIMSLMVRVNGGNASPAATRTPTRSPSPGAQRNQTSSSVGKVSSFLRCGRSSSRDPERMQVGSETPKVYFFEFVTAEEATDFHREISRIRTACSQKLGRGAQ
eukprot:TRINITY_DN61009_c0_g1_i1.p1 TRINITY_DN61009_c0_g1~~TRINITY_DN61009_c0_g1_i1.p1  ORF type:complete len:1043 (-),score=172.52 TRINITY_DN61009_c0_g1_i1:89-3217(-)